MYLLREFSKEEFDELVRKDQVSFDELVTLYQGTWAFGVFLSTQEWMNVREVMTRNIGVFPQSRGLALLTNAFVMSVSSQQKESLELLEEGSLFFEEMQDHSGKGSCHCLMGMVYKTLGMLDKAKELIDSAMGLIDESTIYRHFLVISYYQAGELYALFRDWDTAQNYFEHGMGMLNYESIMKSRFANGIGNILFNKGNYEEAIDSYLQSEKLIGDKQDFRMRSRNYSDIASCYMKFKDTERAIEYLDKSLSLRLQNNQKDAAITDYIKLAEVHLMNGQVDLALKEAETADNLAMELGITIKELQTKKLLSEIYEKKLRYKEALELYRRYAELDNQIQGRELTRKLEQMKSQHELQTMGQEKEIFRLKNVELKTALEEKNESIRYAKRLQEAILPPASTMDTLFTDHFVLFKPKDIVSGDFYWLEQTDEHIFIAAADCTGHGVPGAIVSVVCSNALDRAVKEFGIRDNGKILDKVTELVLETFEKSHADVKDGMDISLLAIHKLSGKITWSGANNPLWYISKGEMKSILPDKQPIGKYDNRKPFTTHSVEAEKGSTFYLFSDGYADQFGGEKGKKFKYKALQELLHANAPLAMAGQQRILDETIENWRGSLEQVDDILVIGLRI